MVPAARMMWSASNAVCLARRSADDDGFDVVASRGEEEFGGLCVKDDAGFAVCTEFVAEGVREVAMREGRELGERGVELREPIREVPVRAARAS